MNHEVVLIVGHAMVYIGAFAALGFSALGSAMGTGMAASAAVGVWKKCYVQKRPAPFQLIILSGFPLSQTIYGMILMFLIIRYGHPAVWPVYVFMGTIAGMGIGVSAWWQGRIGAVGSDCFGDTGEGFTNTMMVLGVTETVPIFLLAFGIVVIMMLDKSLTPETIQEMVLRMSEMTKAIGTAVAK